MDESLRDMERLWNNLFPHASSQQDCDLHVSPAVQAQIASQDANGISLNQRQHPVSGLLYYYSVFAGKTSVYPKLYLPVS
jgi:Tryptophan dimethylallyltransferase